MNDWLKKLALSLVALVIMISCAGVSEQDRSSAVPASSSAEISGYLPAQAVPDSKALLPPPPAPGSAAMALDEAVSQSNLKLRGTPRWQLATQDAVLSFPEAAEIFSCALNAPISEQQTPHLYTLLRRTLIDAGRATGAAKKYYQRKRPFMENGQPTCTPEDESFLRTNGSYPSGHTSAGWAWALILTEIAPERANAILARGRAFGESRIVCNVHWSSDVAEGRVMAAATVARLHAEPAFRADLAAAKEELAAAWSQGLTPGRDCAAEAHALE
ncbi:MAG: phosphatase PAP2 family protein [Desulfobacteraceae bacterium]|nr:phosphatase PAP2 family protein [Desulfobacteraceae bacterium]